MSKAVWLGASVALFAVLAAGTAWYLSQPLFGDAVESPPENAWRIAPVSDALTFARTASPERLFLVTGATADAVEAVDLTAALAGEMTDPLQVMAVAGYAAVEAVAGQVTTTLEWSSLGLPFDAAPVHIAAGTNFRAHAEEVGLEEGPFLFPKLTAATTWNATVPRRTRLDYEAELCGVTLSTHAADRPARLGYVVCNDFTDRWTLVRDIDLDGPLGQSGFPDGKGGPGMLPVGPFLVVPRDDAGFHANIAMGLAVNGVLRQRDSAGLMIWSPAEIANNALAACETGFASRSGRVSITDCAGIPPATLLLTGTPAGVLFHVGHLWSPWSYLQPGDRVLTWADGLGWLDNTVR